MIDEKKLIEAFKKIKMPLMDIIEKVINLQPKIGEWKPFKFGFDKETGREVPTSEIPDDGEEVLVTDGKHIWMDTFFNTGGLCYFDSNAVPGDEVTEWMPLPEPPKGEYKE